MGKNVPVMYFPLFIFQNLKWDYLRGGGFPQMPLSFLTRVLAELVLTRYECDGEYQGVGSLDIISNAPLASIQPYADFVLTIGRL